MLKLLAQNIVTTCTVVARLLILPLCLQKKRQMDNGRKGADEEVYSTHYSKKGGLGWSHIVYVDVRGKLLRVRILVLVYAPRCNDLYLNMSLRKGGWLCVVKSMDGHLVAMLLKKI